jgi:hypothetical protein
MWVVWWRDANDDDVGTSQSSRLDFLAAAADLTSSHEFVSDAMSSRIVRCGVALMHARQYRSSS